MNSPKLKKLWERTNNERLRRRRKEPAELKRARTVKYVNVPDSEILNPPDDAGQIAFWLAKMSRRHWLQILKNLVRFNANAIKTGLTKKQLIKALAPVMLWKEAVMLPGGQGPKNADSRHVQVINFDEKKVSVFMAVANNGFFHKAYREKAEKRLLAIDIASEANTRAVARLFDLDFDDEEFQCDPGRYKGILALMNSRTMKRLTTQKKGGNH